MGTLRVRSCSRYGRAPVWVLVAVGDDDAAELLLVLQDVGVIGQDEVDAGLPLVREHEAGVYQDHVVPVLEGGHVLADAVQAPQRDDLERDVLLWHSWVVPFGWVLQTYETAPRAVPVRIRANCSREGRAARRFHEGFTRTRGSRSRPKIGTLRAGDLGIAALVAHRSKNRRPCHGGFRKTRTLSHHRSQIRRYDEPDAGQSGTRSTFSRSRRHNPELF